MIYFMSSLPNCLRFNLSRRLTSLGACAALLLTPSRAAEIDAEWIGNASGDWKTSANWKDGIVPRTSAVDRYNVLINVPPADLQVALTDNMGISRFTLGNKLYTYALDGAAPRVFRIKDYFHWVGGSLSGWQTQYHIDGEALIDGTGFKYLDSACTLTIHGHARWTEGHLGWAGYSRVDIPAGGTLEVETGGVVGSSESTSSADIFNSGTIRMNAAGQTAQFYTPLHHSGNLQIDAGSFQVMYTLEAGGALNIGQDGRLLVALGKWSAFTGNNEGEIVLNGNQQIASKTVFPGRTRISGGIGGDADVVVENAVWEAGDISGESLLVVPTGGNLLLAVPGAPVFLSRTLMNSGQLRFSAGTRLFGLGGRTHTNDTPGTIEMVSGSAFGSPDYILGSLVNQGTILKRDSEGSAGLYPILQNAGLIKVTAGILRLGMGGASSGILEAQGGGTIEAINVDVTESGALKGDGAIRLGGGKFAGTIDPEVKLRLGSVEMVSPRKYSIEQVQIVGSVRLGADAGLEISKELILNGSIYGGTLRAAGLAELQFESVDFAQGTEVELKGETSWTGGSITLNDQGTTLVNSGQTFLWGKTELQVRPGTKFVNTGVWLASKPVGSMGLILNSTAARLNSSDLSDGSFLEPGDFQLKGNITLASQKLEASPASRIVLSSLSITGAVVTLHNSEMEITQGIKSSKSSFLLDQSRISSRSGALSGTTLIAGAGELDLPLLVDELQLDATAGTNEIALAGPLTMSGSNSVFRANFSTSDGSLKTPYMKVQGPTSLNGRFELAANIAPGSFTLSSAPIVLLEAGEKLKGVFANARSGDSLSTTNKMLRFRIFYGEGSPFGENRIVITEFGTPFDQWRLARFSETALRDPLISGPQADPDRNGFSNLAEFFLALRPENRGGDFPALLEDSKGYTLVRVRRQKDPGAFKARIALSQTLEQWDEVVLGETSPVLNLHLVLELEDSYEFIYRYPGLPDRLFLRTVIESD